MVRKQPDCLTAALEYVRLRWSVIPLCDPDHTSPIPKGHSCKPSRRGKAPLVPWKRWQTERATEEMVREWWDIYPAASVGVIMGVVSGMVAWDVDDDEGMAALLEINGGPLPPTATFTTGGGGRRYLFRWPEGEAPPPAHFKTGAHALTFLGERSYSVMPPSGHSSGKPYRWQPLGRPTFPLPAPTPAMLAALASKVGKNSKGGGGAVPSRNGSKPPDDDHDRVRARGMAATFEPAIQGQGGRYVAFHLACALIHGLHLSEDDAYDVMAEEWNPRCVPPWPADELRERVHSAATEGTYTEIPERPFASRGGRATDNGSCGSPEPEPATATEEEEESFGQLASDLEEGKVEWLIEPWVARGQLTLISGHPSTGKSTLGAWLIGQAGRAVVLPGSEEDPRLMLRPRLLAQGVKLENVLLLNQGEWVFGRDKGRLVKAVQAHRANLVWIDPLDNYMGEADEDVGGPVRRYLESLCYVAQETGAAVVGVRHPGKDPRNLLPGSRHWRTVPRMILELLHDEGPPVRRVCRAHKDSLGKEAAARYYELVGEKGAARVWAWGAIAPEMEVDFIRSNPDRIDRCKIEEAIHLIEYMLVKEEIEISAIYSAGEKERIGDRCIRRAGERIGVKRRREGNGRDHRCYWRLPPGYSFTSDARARG